MSPRHFVLTGGASVEDARDWVESKGHVVIKAVLTPACSVACYGICEVATPSTDEPTR